MKMVFIKKYGWLEILNENGNFALVKMPSGSQIVFNILGFKTKQI